LSIKEFRAVQDFLLLKQLSRTNYAFDHSHLAAVIRFVVDQMMQDPSKASLKSVRMLVARENCIKVGIAVIRKRGQRSQMNSVKNIDSVAGGIILKSKIRHRRIVQMGKLCVSSVIGFFRAASIHQN
jgi:hypothetical protein